MDDLGIPLFLETSIYKTQACLERWACARYFVKIIGDTYVNVNIHTYTFRKTHICDLSWQFIWFVMKCKNMQVRLGTENIKKIKRIQLRYESLIGNHKTWRNQNMRKLFSTSSFENMYLPSIASKKQQNIRAIYIYIWIYIYIYKYKSFESFPSHAEPLRHFFGWGCLGTIGYQGQCTHFGKAPTTPSRWMIQGLF